ncbi:MAG TPA: amylo-alpha-1,6-glucosidase [Geminicoccaceae bacterium]
MGAEPHPTTDAGLDLQAEWLEADGCGGFASGTVGGARTRRYHALLLAATMPPAGRMVLVNGLEAWIETPDGRFAISTQRYAPDVVHPDGERRISGFRAEPYPQWSFRAEDGTEVGHEILAVHGRPEVVLRWRLLGGEGPVRLLVRPLLSGRDYHALHHENDGFDFAAEVAGQRVTWRPYHDVPAVTALANADYQVDPLWYRNFQYDAERARGLDFTEDLASPGVFAWRLDEHDAVLVLRVEAAPAPGAELEADAVSYGNRLIEQEVERRGRFASPLHRSADQYVVRRGSGRTIVAGYPWFTDWGRDTFISLRGFMLLPGGLELARDILSAWAPAVSEGMLPNRFPDAGDVPEYNSVDASLWYVIVAQAFLDAADASGLALADRERAALDGAIASIIAGYRSGTRFGIRMDDDGLIAAGVPGVQLTWMDAKIGDWVVTPRVGKPVEIQALWLNLLAAAATRSPELSDLHRRAAASFRDRFWNAERGCLFDVVDVDHVAGRNDDTIRPNQIFAVGGLPHALFEGEQARRVVEVVERDLLTPLGLRSLAPGEPGYRPHFGGGVTERDSAYHQGTVWPWLIGPFVEAWLRVREGEADAPREADQRFLAPLRAHLATAGLGHVSEVADAEAPYTPGGCPFQAWSLAALLRASRLVDGPANQPPRPLRQRPR